MATIKKAQAGVKLSPQQKRAQMDSVASVKRAEIVRKKDSILNRQAAAKGMTREQQRAQQLADKKKPDAKLDGLQTSKANKRCDTKGSCTTGATMGGDSLKDVKKNGGKITPVPNGPLVKKKGPFKGSTLKSGGMIKRADGSMSKRGLWDNLRSKAAQNKKTGAKPKAPTKTMLAQEKKIKAKSKK